MALWICTGCTTRYSVGAPRCPQCGDTRHVEEGADDMAKITVHGGATNQAAEDEAGDAGEGGEQSSQADTTSSPSSETEGTAPEPNEPAPQRPARKTGSRSKKGLTASSSAAGTDGGPEDGTSETDGPDA